MLSEFQPCRFVRPEVFLRETSRLSEKIGSILLSDPQNIRRAVVGRQTLFHAQSRRAELRRETGVKNTPVIMSE